MDEKTRGRRLRNIKETKKRTIEAAMGDGVLSFLCTEGQKNLILHLQRGFNILDSQLYVFSTRFE